MTSSRTIPTTLLEHIKRVRRRRRRKISVKGLYIRKRLLIKDKR
jgi:hypothetical protein